MNKANMNKGKTLKRIAHIINPLLLLELLRVAQRSALLKKTG